MEFDSTSCSPVLSEAVLGKFDRIASSLTLLSGNFHIQRILCLFSTLYHNKKHHYNYFSYVYTLLIMTCNTTVHLSNKAVRSPNHY